MIQKYALEFDLDPVLVFAIVDTESHFNPRAKSTQGALGMMQIMPKTGQWISELLGYRNFREEDLFDPEINVRFGCCYLFYLFTRFSEEWQVVAAYNAGEGQVAEWLAKEIDETTVPFSETSNYLKKVKRAKEYYKDKKFVAFD